MVLLFTLQVCNGGDHSGVGLQLLALRPQNRPAAEHQVAMTAAPGDGNEAEQKQRAETLIGRGESRTDSWTTARSTATKSLWQPFRSRHGNDACKLRDGWFYCNTHTLQGHHWSTTGAPLEHHWRHPLERLWTRDVNSSSKSFYFGLSSRSFRFHQSHDCQFCKPMIKIYKINLLCVVVVVFYACDSFVFRHKSDSRSVCNHQSED